MKSQTVISIFMYKYYVQKCITDLCMYYYVFMAEITSAAEGRRSLTKSDEFFPRYRRERLGDSSDTLRARPTAPCSAVSFAHSARVNRERKKMALLVRNVCKTISQVTKFVRPR